MIAVCPAVLGTDQCSATWPSVGVAVSVSGAVGVTESALSAATRSMRGTAAMDAGGSDEPMSRSVTAAPVVRNAFNTVVNVASGRPDSSSANAPATNGVAIDVPLNTP